MTTYDLRLSDLTQLCKFVETAHWLHIQAVPAQAHLTLSRQQSLAWTHSPTPAALCRLSDSGYAECPLTAAHQGHLVWQPVSDYLLELACWDAGWLWGEKGLWRLIAASSIGRVAARKGALRWLGCRTALQQSRGIVYVACNHGNVVSIKRCVSVCQQGRKMRNRTNLRARRGRCGASYRKGIRITTFSRYGLRDRKVLARNFLPLYYVFLTAIAQNMRKIHIRSRYELRIN